MAQKFTLYEFLQDTCENKAESLYEKRGVLIQTIADGLVISRYLDLLQQRLTTITVFLENLARIPGIIKSEIYGYSQKIVPNLLTKDK